MNLPQTHQKLRPSLGRLRGKIAIVTGAARGIGNSIAEVLGHEGAEILIFDKNKIDGEKAASTLRARGQKASFIEVDLLNQPQLAKIFQTILTSIGTPDILINNVRSGKRSGVHQPMQEWNSQIDVMLTSVFYLSSLSINAMKEKRSGAILNISSVAEMLACPESPAYHAAKGGVASLTRCLAHQAGHFGIRVNSLCPGHVLKADQENQPAPWKPFIESILPLRRVPTSIEIGYSALFLCSDEASIITGQSIFVDGGLSIVEHTQLLREAGLAETLT